MIKCHIYTRSLVKDEKKRKRDTLFPNISNVYNKKMQWKWNKRCFMSSFSYNSKKHIYSARAAWFFKVIKQTLMRSKCKMLHTVLEKFLSYSLDISTVNSEYKKIFKPSPSAEWNLKNWCSAWSLYHSHSLSLPLSLSFSHFLDNISQQIIAMH